MATAFSTVSKGASVTLSGSNLTATVSSGTGSVGSDRRISGLTYFEMVVGGTLTGSARIGLCNSSFTFTTLLGGDVINSSVGYDSGGTVKINNATAATIATYTTGSNIGVAINTNTGLIWFRVGGGNWNNAVIGSQNPVGSVGGISISAVTTASLLVAWGGSATSSVTAIFSSGSWSFSAPTGYSSIDTNQSLLVPADATVVSSVKHALPTSTVKFLGVINTNGNLSPTPYATVLPPGVTTVAYTETIAAQGGSAPYTFSLVSGSLPTGLSLNSSTGVISGTPTVAGSYSFTIQASDVHVVIGSTAFSIAVSLIVTNAVNFGFAS